MTYNNAREYCKTGTNAWNGTLVAWRDLETQLAVEQYFFVGGAALLLGGLRRRCWPRAAGMLRSCCWPGLVLGRCQHHCVRRLSGMRARSMCRSHKGTAPRHMNLAPRGQTKASTGARTSRCRITATASTGPWTELATPSAASYPPTASARRKSGPMRTGAQATQMALLAGSAAHTAMLHALRPWAPSTAALRRASRARTRRSTAGACATCRANGRLASSATPRVSILLVCVTCAHACWTSWLGCLGAGVGWGATRT
jgi:hypothetical protein